MPVDILVPPLSQTMDTLVLVEWLKAVGDAVAKDEPLFTVETDKATLEVEAPAGGTLHEVWAEPGDEITVRESIGLILKPGESAPAPRASEPAALAPAAREPEPAEGTGSAEALSPEALEALPPHRRNRIFASPRARRLADQHSVPLEALSPTGPQEMIVERDVQAHLDAAPRPTPVARRMAEQHGVDLDTLAQPGEKITRADVEAAVQARAPAKAPGGRAVPLSATRQTIARRMQASHQETAPVTLTREVNATALVALRERILEELVGQGVRPSFTDFLVMIVARALRAHPHLNAHFDGESLTVFDAVHMGLAVDTDHGLMVPVIRDAAGKGLVEVAHARRDLIERAYTRELPPETLTGSTFTVTNLGPLGIDGFTPLINPPETGILGIGRTRKVPLVQDGEIVAGQVTVLSLTFDHRVIDGAPAARFLKDIADRVETPDLIWL